MNIETTYITSSGINEGTVTIVDVICNGRDTYVVYIDDSGTLKRDTKVSPISASGSAFNLSVPGTTTVVSPSASSTSSASSASSGSSISSYLPYWDDLRFPSTAINPPGKVSDPTWDINNIGWSFSNGKTEVITIVAQLPHSYKEGTDIHPHIHWMPSNTNVGNVLWRMSWTWTNNEETQEALIDSDILVPANGTTLKHQLDSFTPISKANAKISSMITLKLSRIGGSVSDSFTGNAILKEFDIHYISDTLGSILELSK